MQHNPGNLALLPRPARHTPFAPFAPEGVTVCMTSAVLAPAPAAPAAAETPVFVDDSGARKRLLRITGVLLGLLAIGFLGVVGIAIATPSVAPRSASATSPPSWCPARPHPRPPRPPPRRCRPPSPSPRPRPAPPR